MGNDSLADSIAERLLVDFRNEPYLPSERNLSEYFNCNRMTVRRALEILTARNLLSTSNRKHILSDKIKNSTVAPRIKERVIMVLSFEKELLDHTRTYMLGGIIHEAARCGLKLVFRELNEDMLQKITSYREIDDGFDIAGYLVTGGAPMRLHDILSSSMKPSIINGTFLEEKNLKCRIRFMEIRIDYVAIFREIASRLLALGHRKILLAHTARSFMVEQIAQGIHDALKQFDLPSSILDVKVYNVDIFSSTNADIRYFARELAADAQHCSALILPCGNIFGMEAVNALQEKQINIPEDLSLIMLGYETDYFIPTQGISSIWADVRELGAFCIRELDRQIKSGRTEYGISYFSTTFTDRKTLAEAKKKNDSK